MKGWLEGILPKNQFSRSVSLLVGGTASGQLIVIAASPILTRLYTPEDFGLLAVYSGILAILGVIASMRYQLAIPLPESNAEAASVAILSLLMVGVTTIFSAVVVWLIGWKIVNFLNTPSLAPYLWLIPVGLFLVGVYQVFQYWAIRMEAFSIIARSRLTQSLGMVITQISGYTLGPSALLLGRVVGQSAGILGLVKSALSRNGNDFNGVTPAKVKWVAREYKKFPLISTWTGLASSGGSNLPPILIAVFFGAGPAGMFALAHRVLSQPMAIIGQAVGDVFYRQAAEAHRVGKLDYTVFRVHSSLVIIALSPALFSFLIIPDLFVLIFGENWYKAGEISRWMVPWLFLQLVITPSTRVYPILGLHGTALRFQLSLLFSTIISVLIGGIYFDSLIATIAIMSALNSMIYLWRAAYTFALVGLKKRDSILSLLKSLPIAVLCSLPVIVLVVLYGGILEAGLVGFLMVTLSLALLVVNGFYAVKKVF